MTTAKSVSGAAVCAREARELVKLCECLFIACVDLNPLSFSAVDVLAGS